MTFSLWVCFVFVLTAPAAVAGEPVEPDSVEQQADTAHQKRKKPMDSTFVYEYIAHPFLRLISWPVEKFAVPVFKTALFPLIRP